MMEGGRYRDRSSRSRVPLALPCVVAAAYAIRSGRSLDLRLAAATAAEVGEPSKIR